MSRGEGGGRPPKFTIQTRRKILDGIRKLLPYKYCAWFARIHERHLYDWLQIGNEDLYNGVVSEYAKFSQDVKEARSLNAFKHLMSIEEGDKNWQSRAWILERSDYETFGQDGGLAVKIAEKIDAIEARLQGGKKDEINSLKV